MVCDNFGRGTHRGTGPAGAAALLFVLLAASVSAAAPAVQTRPWRVAVAGGYGIGYMGLLSLNGLPRQRLNDTELTDLDRLKQFDVVITATASNTPAALAALEKFAAEGGTVLIEGPATPSAEAIPGRRLSPDSAPNIVFVPSSSPISRGLPELGVIYTAAYGAASIIPPAGSPAVVLARFTNEGAPEKFRNHLFDGDQGAPAIIQAPYGKGQIIYSGPPLSIQFSLVGRKMEPFICALLDQISGGQLRGRFSAQPLENGQLVTAPQEAPPPPPYPAPAGKPAPLPKGFTELEGAADLQDFCLTATPAPPAEGRILLGYWSPGETTELVFGGGKLTMIRNADGKVLGKRSVPSPQPAAQILVMRRGSLVTVSQGGQVLLQRCLGRCRQGSLACSGLKDPEYQPLAAIEFDDDFMRDSGEKGEWQVVRGDWQLAASEGKPEQGANPFNYQVSSTDPALTMAGEGFWTDYSVAASLKSACASAGVIAGYRGPDDYLALRLAVNPGDPKASKLQLVRRTAAGEKVIGEGTVTAAPADWHRLELRTSSGRTQGLLNGQVRIEYAGETVRGAVGLAAQGGQANFDDVRVRSWLASPAEEAPRCERLLLSGGTWVTQGASQLTGSGGAGASALLPWPAVDGCSASAEVLPAQSEAAGLLLKASDRGAVALTLVRSGGKLRLQCERRGVHPEVLLDQPVAGVPTQWQRLGARCRGNRLQVILNGAIRADLLDAYSAPGSVGLYVRGRRPASFADLRAWQEPPGDGLVDEPTQSFAGIIDRNSWAGRSAAWCPDPARLNCLWHFGTFPGEVELQVGVHPAEAPASTTRLCLSPRDQTDRGYLVTARRTWKTDKVDVTLSFQGRYLASGSAALPAGEAYALGLQRLGNALLVTVNSRPVLSCRDKQARRDCDSLAVDNGGELLHAEDIAVRSDLARDYTFETAPTEWQVESGEWKLSSRWSCTPGWAWLAGINTEGDALISSRRVYGGDLQIVSYVGAKMMPGFERLTDVHLGCCADSTSPVSGYHFVLGGQVNTVTQLLRNGKVVADSPFRISQGGIHNDWTRLTVRKQGGTIGLWVWDTPVLQWQDPEPLKSGRLVIGTQKNGISIPRVTVFGSEG